MKTHVIFYVLLLAVLILIFNNLAGEIKKGNDPKFILPAVIIEGDTIPVINFPVIVISGEKKLSGAVTYQE